MVFSLRLASSDLRDDLATGDERIDSYLLALDRALAGVAGVRRPTVLEVREFLLMERDRALAVGGDTQAAVTDAIAILGTVEELAREQRATLRARYLRTVAIMGLSFSVMMLLVSLQQTGLPGADWTTLAGSFVRDGMIAGIVAGYLFTYVLKSAEPPATDETDSGEFHVYFGPTSVVASWALVVAFGLSTVLLVASLVGAGPFVSMSPVMAAAMLLLCLRLTLGGLRAARFKARVDAKLLRIEGLFGSVRIARTAITGTGRATGLLQVLIPGAGLSHWIQWRDERGSTQRTYVSISKELVQGDRLIAWLESAAAAAHP